MLLIILVTWQACQLVLPGESDLILKLIVLCARQKGEHFLSMSLNVKQIVVADDNLLELLAKVYVSLAKARMHGVLKLQTVRILVTYSNVTVLNDGVAHIVLHGARLFIAHPGVNTSTAGKDPKQVHEVKVFLQRLLDNMHRNLQVGKASLAHVGTLAARPHIIVIVHINIEDHLFLQRHECFLVARIVTIWRNIIDGSNIDLVGNFVDEGLSEVLSVLEAKVTTVDVISECKTKLALMEVGRVRAIIETQQ